MTGSDGNPTAWTDFNRLSADQPIAWSAPFARFASRYRMARRFDGLRHSGDGPGRSDSLDDLGYDSLLGLAFAATALDSLEVALAANQRPSMPGPDADPADVALRSTDLRDRWFGRPLKPVRFAVASFLGSESRTRVAAIEDADMRPIVDAFHDLALRGDVTPAALQFDRILDNSFLEDLRRFTLDATDAAFTAWVDSAAASR